MVKEKKYHIVYKTTNLINGKQYIGVHSTNKIEDGYLGCGFYKNYDINKLKSTRGIRGAFKKYGIDNFTREVLFIFDTAEEAYQKEEELVNTSWVNNLKSYNLSIGGRYSGQCPLEADHLEKLIDLHSREYIVVNIKTNEIFEVKNLNKWSREMGLCVNTPNSPLCYVATGKSRLIKDTWWCCYKEDWTGKPVVRPRKKVEIPYMLGKRKKKESLIYKDITLIKDDKEIIISTLYSFCQENDLDFSNLLKVVKGKSKSYRGYKIKQ